MEILQIECKITLKIIFSRHPASTKKNLGSMFIRGHPVCAEKDVSENARERIEKG